MATPAVRPPRPLPPAPHPRSPDPGLPGPRGPPSVRPRRCYPLAVSTPTVQPLILLGSTGSIGVQTLEVARHLSSLADRGEGSARYEVVALAAGRRASVALEQAAATGARLVALADESGAADAGLADGDTLPTGARVLVGQDAAERLVHESRDLLADRAEQNTPKPIAVSAIVGVAGLAPTLAAVDAGFDVALANKEALVAAGAIVTARARERGVRLLPVDSEHSGVWQALGGGLGAVVPPFDCPSDVRRIVLTASGGALRDHPVDAVARATVEEALAHPNWSMGAKVTVDTASLVNKALELIEAHWLFGVGSDRLAALVHPCSTVHALVEFADGSVVAQMGSPDMRTPIQVALTHPRRLPGLAPPLDLRAHHDLEFREPDPERYPALAIGFHVIDRGGTAGAVFNAANERAAQAFLDRRIAFGEIAELIARAVEEVGSSGASDLSAVLDADSAARESVDRALLKRAAPSGAARRA